MMNKTVKFMFAAACLVVGMALGEPAIRDRSVVGYWKFDGDTDEQRKSDLSGQGGVLTGFASGVSISSTGGNEGGCLSIMTAGNAATATLGVSLPTGSHPTFAVWAKRHPDMNELPTSGYGVDNNIAMFAGNFNDKDHWHMLAECYEDKMWGGSSGVYADVCDPENLNVSPKPETVDSSSAFPMSVSGSKFTIGGKLKGSSSYKFKGWFDDVMVINRFMTRCELTRLYKTHETYVYPTGDIEFGTHIGWSIRSDLKAGSAAAGWKPGDIYGAAYVVDQGKTLMSAADENATFGADVANEISLTLGRLSSTVVTTLDGGFRHHASNRSTTFFDLRLNDGAITASADGQSLSTALLDVEATAEKPFAIAVGSGLAYTFNAGGKVTGSGVVAKTGAGKLTLDNFKAASGENPRFRMADGQLKAARFDGYTGGTVLVTTDATVAFTGEDVLPTAENKMRIAFDGAKPTAKTAVMTVPTGVTAAMIQDATTYDAGKVGIVTVENGTVYVEPTYVEDLGPVPVLMAE